MGHLSKLVHQEELSDTFGELGDIVSIDLISPRGCAFICMNRRQDAYRALTKLKNHKMQSKAITVLVNYIFSIVFFSNCRILKETIFYSSPGLRGKELKEKNGKIIGKSSWELVIFLGIN